MTATQLGAVLAAFTAGLLTMFGIIVVRGTKISEFRIKWIDEQRQDLSLVLASASRLATEPSSKREEYLLSVETAANRIRLRENPEKPEWAEIIEQIDAIRLKLSQVPPRSVDIDSERKLIVATARVRLKSEWKRVKRGELGYRLFYICAAVCIMSAFILGVFGVTLHFLGHLLPFGIQLSKTAAP